MILLAKKMLRLHYFMQTNLNRIINKTQTIPFH